MRPRLKHRCKVPPNGWLCSRQPGHEGPCAAYRNVGMPHPLLTVAGDLVIATVIIAILAHIYNFLGWALK